MKSSEFDACAWGSGTTVVIKGIPGEHKIFGVDFENWAVELAHDLPDQRIPGLNVECRDIMEVKNKC